MARQQSSSILRVDWVPGVNAFANPAAPTLAELATGTNLSNARLHDGLSTPRSPNMVDASDAGSLDTKQSVGTRDVGPITLTAHRDSDPLLDTAWAALIEDAYGYLVVRRFGGSNTAYAAGQKVETYPVQVATKGNADTALNQTQRFTATFAVTQQSVLEATVAA